MVVDDDARRPQEWTVELRERIAQLMPQARRDLAELVAFKSVADPRQQPKEECENAARWVAERFTELGFANAQLAPMPDGSNAVIGSRPCGNPAAPTVLLYAHFDVQPAPDDGSWRTPPFELTEVDGRWYGRGAADCKGNILMHLTALRALGDDVPVNLKLVIEGSEEQDGAGIETFVPNNAELLRADAILVCDSGNAAVGSPALTVTLRGIVNVVVTVEALAAELHSGSFGGAAPDALAALIAMLATLRDSDGNTTIVGLDNTQKWEGAPYAVEQFRSDAGVLDGVGLLGDGDVADMLWARPAVTILGIDCQPVVGSPSAITPKAAARVSLRVPPGMDVADALQALTDHLNANAPWGVHVTVESDGAGRPFEAVADGPAYTAIADAMLDAYGVPMTTLGEGGSIPLCNVFAETFPAAEIILMGVEEPAAAIHAPNESVDPSELESMALAEALFLRDYPTKLGRHRAR